MDKGPEYISVKLLEWAEKHGISIQHIQPGKPQQNAYIKRDQAAWVSIVRKLQDFTKHQRLFPGARV